MSVAGVALVAHGGAWAIPDSLQQESMAALRNAVCVGYRLLGRRATALEVVEQAVTSLEDTAAFDAGYGSYLTASGEVEMDAIVMDGRTLRAGAVGAITNVKNPVQVARKVMEETDHCLLAGDGANRFAKDQGFPYVPTEDLVSPYARQKWEEYKKFVSAVKADFSSRSQRVPEGHDTVGAVAIDADGNIACATSTGGITAQLPGRVGDSPVIGSGGYADNEVGGVSTTGHGEAIMRVCLAHRILMLMNSGVPPQQAADQSLEYMSKKVGKGCGGCIVISKSGEVTVSFNSPRMAWAYASGGELHYGIDPGQHVVEPI